MIVLSNPQLYPFYRWDIEKLRTFPKLCNLSMMEPRLTSRHAGFIPHSADAIIVPVNLFTSSTRLCAPGDEDLDDLCLVPGAFTQRQAQCECLQNVFVQQMDQWARSMETFTLSGFSSSIVSQQNFRRFSYVAFGMVFLASLPVPVTAGLGCGSGAHQQVPWRTQCLSWVTKSERGQWWNSCGISFHVTITPSVSRMRGGSALDGFLSFFLSV